MPDDIILCKSTLSGSPEELYKQIIVSAKMCCENLTVKASCTKVGKTFKLLLLSEGEKIPIGNEAVILPCIEGKSGTLM